MNYEDRNWLKPDGYGSRAPLVASRRSRAMDGHRAPVCVLSGLQNLGSDEVSGVYSRLRTRTNQLNAGEDAIA
jgi:hypothetical protein